MFLNALFDAASPTEVIRSPNDDDVANNSSWIGEEEQQVHYLPHAPTVYDKSNTAPLAELELAHAVELTVLSAVVPTYLTSAGVSAHSSLQQKN